jgi:Peptidase family M28
MSPLKPLPCHFVDSSSTAAGPSRVSANADSVAAAVDVSTIETDVRYLAAPELQGRLRGTEGNARARAQIVASLKAAGLAPLFNDSFEQPTYPNGGDREPYAINVGAIFLAPDRDARWIVLVAHYDHRGVIDGKVQAGADDNASSVALVLALGHALGRTRPALRRHVVLLFPDAEEPPDVRTERMGSSWFWRNPGVAARLDPDPGGAVASLRMVVRAVVELLRLPGVYSNAAILPSRMDCRTALPRR